MINNYLQYEYSPCDLIHAFDEQKKHCIYLGDVSAALDLEFIKRSNIKTVVTAAASMDQVSYSPQQNIKHVVYSVLDHKNQNLITYFDQFFDLVQKQIRNGSVLVHCAAGISRSSTLVISYLMRKNNLSFKDAIKYVRNSRPTVLPNLGFQRQLKEYQKVIIQQQHRRLKSKTSQSNKHGQNKNQILPEIGILGMNNPKNKILDAFRIYKNQQMQKVNRRNFLINNPTAKNDTKLNSLKYQQIQKFKPLSRQFGQTKSVSLQQGLQRNPKTYDQANRINSYLQVKTDQGEVGSSGRQINSRNGLFDSAIIPIKYNTMNKPLDKLKKTNIKFGNLNGNNITLNRINIFKQKYSKNTPALSLGKVAVNENIEVSGKNQIETGFMELKTKQNFAIKLSKVRQNQFDIQNNPFVIGKKEIGFFKKDIGLMKKQIQVPKKETGLQIKNDEIFRNEDYKKVTIKNLLFNNDN